MENIYIAIRSAVVFLAIPLLGCVSGEANSSATCSIRDETELGERLHGASEDWVYKVYRFYLNRNSRTITVLDHESNCVVGAKRLPATMQANSVYELNRDKMRKVRSQVGDYYSNQLYSECTKGKDAFITAMSPQAQTFLRSIYNGNSGFDNPVAICSNAVSIMGDWVIVSDERQLLKVRVINGKIFSEVKYGN